jgi:hypothetical protein
MAAGEPDAAAVITLAALVTVLTFLSGFVSVRLHDAYRDAVERRRQLEAQLITGHGVFPEWELEDDFEATRGAIGDALATPVLVVLVAFTIVGLLLDVATVQAAHLHWFDLRALERSGALWLLALALVVVTSLVVADYVRLRRRLGTAVDESPVRAVLRAEASVGRVWTAKRGQVDAELKGEYAYFEWLGAAEKLAEARADAKTRLAEIEKTPPAQRDKAWERNRAKLLTALRRHDDAAKAVVKARKAVEHKFSDESAAAASELDKAKPDLDKAQQSLAQLGARPGWRDWGHLVGLRAIATLVDAFSPESEGPTDTTEEVTRIRGWLQAAKNAQPDEPRWVEADAFLEEKLGDTAKAAELTIRALELQGQASERAASLLAPAENSQGWAQPIARQPSTYFAAFELKKQARDWTEAGLFAQVAMLALCREPLLNLGTTYRRTFAHVMDCIREVVAGECSDGELGFWSAEQFLKSCQEISDGCLARRTLGIDLAEQFSSIKRLVEPGRAAFDEKAAAKDARITDREFERLSMTLGIVIEDGDVKVEGQDGSCRLDAARASVTPAATGRWARLLGSSRQGEEGEMSIAITAKDFEPVVKVDPHEVDARRAQQWADEFNQRAGKEAADRQRAEGAREGAPAPPPNDDGALNPPD